MTTTQIMTILITWIKTVLGSHYEVIRGETSAPRPKKEYLVIHQPMALQEYSSGNFFPADDEGNVEYKKHWQGTISIEEVGFQDNGDKLRTLLDSLRLQTTRDYFRSSKVSILREEGINPIPQLTENIWELRTNLDLIILFPDEGTYQPGYINTVKINTTYENPDVWEDQELVINE